MRIPLLAPAAALAAGVGTASLAVFEPESTLLATVLLAALGLAVLRAMRPWAGIVALACAFFFAGLGLAELPTSEPPHRVDRILAGFDGTVRLRGWVRRPPVALVERDRFVLEVESVWDGRPASGGVAVTVQRDPNAVPLRLAYGTRVEFLARVRRPRNYGNPGAFDRVGWLADQGIFLNASVRVGTPLLPSPSSRGEALDGRLWQLRTALDGRVDSLERELGVAGTSAAGVVRAMTLGDTDAVDPDIRSDFERSGAYHVLVVSGMHVGLLAAIAIGLVRVAGMPSFCSWLTGAAVAAAYALLLEADLPVSRAAWMLAAYLAAAALYRKRNALNVICGVGMVFLCWNPQWIFDAGFQLSFLSVAVIAALGAPAADRLVSPRLLSLKDIWNLDRDLRLPVEVVERRVALRDWLEPLAHLARVRQDWLASLLLAPVRLFWAGAAAMLVSGAVTAVLAGPLAFHFQRVSGVSPIANLVALPALSVIAPSGLAAMAIGSTALYRTAFIGAEGLVWIAGHTAQAGALQYAPPPPTVWMLLLSFASCAWLVWALPKGRRVALPALAAAICATAVIAWYPLASDIHAGRLEMTAIDVGQGEALLMGLPTGGAGLVDAGGLPTFREGEETDFDVGERLVSPYLGERRIKRLSFLALTHADADHLSGAVAVAERFRPRELWVAKTLLAKDYRPLLDVATARGVRVRFLEDGESFTFGGATVTASLCASCEKRNDRSLVLSFDYGEHRFLLTGDIERQGERRLAKRLARRATVLKVGHHGSRNSTSVELLDAAQPAVALISAGYRNLYGHPHQDVLDRLRARRVRVLRTDLDGASTVSSDGHRLAVSTYRLSQASARSF